MDKPIINQFNSYPTMRFQQYERYLPSAFDETLSFLQKLNLIIKRMNQLGEVSNSVIDQWNQVMEWVMNDGLTNDVINKLNEMVTDGTLDQIINTTIFNELNTQISTIKSKSNSESINVLYPPSPLVGLKGDYNYQTNSGTDDSTALQALIDFAYANGGLKLIFPPRLYYINQDIHIKDNVTLDGLVFMGGKLDTAMVSLKGAVLIFKNAPSVTIHLGQNATVKNFTIFYPEQHYAIQNDGSAADGLENFIDYNWTFETEMTNGAPFTLKNIVAIGASHFCRQGTNSGNLTMRFHIENIFGFVTKVGFDFSIVYDVSRIINVHFSCTFSWDIPDLRGFSNVLRNTPSKITQTLTVFLFGKVDGIILESCFAFGCKTFIECYTSSVGGGAWLLLNKCFADCCKYGFLIHSTNGQYFVNNSTFSPIINRHADVREGDTAIIPNVTDDNSPSAMLRIDQTATNNKIMLSNVETFGTINGSISDTFTKSCNSPFLIDTPNQNNIQVSNSNFRNYIASLFSTNTNNPIFASNCLNNSSYLIDGVYGSIYAEWNPLTLLNGSTLTTNGMNRISISKDGYATLELDVIPPTNAGTPIAQLSNDFYPQSFFRAVVPTSSGTSLATIEISQTTGQIVMGNATTLSDAQAGIYLRLTWKCKQTAYGMLNN